jgi:hydrogenase small subunit
MPTLLWIESGSCSGETLSLLGAEGPGSRAPSFLEFLEETRLRLLWHPSFSSETPAEVGKIFDAIAAGQQELTVLCIEGSILHGPDGTGRYDTFLGTPKRDLIAALCGRAHFVLAMGTCAAFGGIPAAAPNPTQATGLQFTLEEPGGLLAAEWRSKSGLPVINLAGCPVPSATMFKTLRWMMRGMPLEVDSFNRPFTVGPCNSDVWSKPCGKPRVGFACYGCIGAGFPKEGSLFRHLEIGHAEGPMEANGRHKQTYFEYGACAAEPPRVLLPVLP